MEIKSSQIIAQEKILNITEYERLIKYYRYYKQDSAIYLAQQGIEFARRQNDSVAVALMLIQMGMIDDNQGKSSF